MEGLPGAVRDVVRDLGGREGRLPRRRSDADEFSTSAMGVSDSVSSGSLAEGPMYVVRYKFGLHSCYAPSKGGVSAGKVSAGTMTSIFGSTIAAARVREACDRPGPGDTLCLQALPLPLGHPGLVDSKS
jgi:hypothetical protein